MGTDLCLPLSLLKSGRYLAWSYIKAASPRQPLPAAQTPSDGPNADLSSGPVTLPPSCQLPSSFYICQTCPQPVQRLHNPGVAVKTCHKSRIVSNTLFGRAFSGVPCRFVCLSQVSLGTTTVCCSQVMIVPPQFPLPSPPCSPAFSRPCERCLYLSACSSRPIYRPWLSAWGCQVSPFNVALRPRLQVHVPRDCVAARITHLILFSLVQHPFRLSDFCACY